MIKEYLNQPYPLSGNKLRLTISISLFIGLFMLIFQPFGLSNYNGPYKSILCIGYSFVTFITLILDLYIIQIVFKSWFKNKYWTVQKQITWLVWIIFTIGLGNFIYTSIVFSIWSLKSFLLFQFYTLSVGIFPIIVITVIQQNTLLSQNLKSSLEFNTSLNNKVEIPGNEIVYLLADNEKDKFEIELSNLLYIESTGNYIEIFYTKNYLLKNSILRSTLKRTEIQLEKHTSVLKCHRAFLVNTHKILQVKGNSQGLKLELLNTETEIPVSRNFSKSLKDKLNSYQ